MTAKSRSSLSDDDDMKFIIRYFPVFVGYGGLVPADPTGESCGSSFLNYVGATLAAIGLAVGGITTTPTGVGAVGFGIALAGTLTVVAATRIQVYEDCGA